MPDELSAILLADVLRAANELVSAGLIEDYALVVPWPRSTTPNVSPLTTPILFSSQRTTR
jgi:hypothetical protein